MIDFMIDTGLGAVPARFCEAPADYARMHQWMRERASVVLGLDTETNAHDPWDDNFAVRLIQISDGAEAWLCEPNDQTTRDINLHPQFVAHYSEAEVRFLGRGVPGTVRLQDAKPHILDTQPILAFYDPRTLLPRKDGIDPRLVHPKGLKDTFTREFSPKLKDAEDALNAWFAAHAPKGSRTPAASRTWGFEHVPVRQPEYLQYGAFDAIAVKWLYDKMCNSRQYALNLDAIWRALLRQWDIDRMTFRGAPLDAQYVRWLHSELRGLITANGLLLRAHGIGESAMGASVGAAFEALGAKSNKTTKLGKPAWDKDVINELVDHPDSRVSGLATIVKRSRQAGKFESSYVRPMLGSIQRDNRLHCSFRSVGTVTHRDSAANPPMQQLPKKDPRIRAAIGNTPGWLVVSCDFAQGEPRVMAAHSGDPAYRAALDTGDINSAIAAEAFGDAFNPAEGKKAGTPSYLMRNAAKAGFLAYCYGVGDSKGARTVGVGIEQWREMRQRWTQAYRVLFQRAQKLNEAERVVLPSGRAVTLWDRKFVGPDGHVLDSGRSSRKALNYETQSAQKDVLEAAWFRPVLAGGESLRDRYQHYVILFLHDEIVLHVPDWMAEMARDDLKTAMTIPLGNSVVMECEATIDGLTWLPQDMVSPEDLVSSVDMDDEDL